MVQPEEPHFSLHQSKALRLLRLLELLKQKPWKPAELRAELGLGERAIFDYLQEVRLLAESLGQRLVHDPLRSTYTLEVEEKLSLTEAVVAHMAVRMLAHHSPGSNKAYQEALRKLAQRLPEPLKKIALQSTQALAERPASLSGANLETLTQAWLERRVVAFDYQLPQGRLLRGELEVYFIEVSRANMAVYVIGRDRAYGRGIHYLESLKAYKLERIQRVRLLDETYTIPHDFDPQAYLSTAWGIVASENPLVVRLKFAPEAAYRLREGGYPNLRILEQLEGGSTLVEITVGTDDSGFPLELLPWIQSWGPRVEVLEPSSLREAWLAEARLLLQQYDSSDSMKPKTYWAHSHKDPLRWQPLKEHLEAVARLAAHKAQAFGEAKRARQAGLLHDLGKYGEAFQRRLRGQEKGLDHWSAGAHLALFEYRDPGVALAIQGHHIGLHSGSKDSLKEMRLKESGEGFPPELRLSEGNLEQLKARMTQDGLALPPPSEERVPLPTSAAAMLDTRMLFSALVDADYLDTEQHMQGPVRPNPPPLQAEKALKKLEAYLEELAHQERIPPAIRHLRQQVSQASAQAAQGEGRLFTLTAPTGLGKTLAMLRFALVRAVRDPRIRRVVVVLPYLSILDQTAKIYRDLFDQDNFGPNYLLEDHSLAYRPLREGSSDEQDLAERERRLLVQNWEAPIVLTTHVQLLESLHGHRPGACRKLHNLAGSVLLFDEVQTLPTHLAVPTLKTLAHLASEKYGAVVVFATATQPAFEALHDKVKEGEPEGVGWQPKEILPQPEAFFAQTQRVQVDWWLAKPTPNPYLVTLLAADEQALMVMNLKRQAHALFRQAQAEGLEGLFHLSTALCPAHRLAVLEEVQKRLEEKAPCRLVSTQVVEAGVELDFPVGYRALAPLEAIAQTAGRVNRHGHYPKGWLVVFLPEDEGYPDRAYRQAAQLTRALQAEGALGLEPATFRRYYQSLYHLQAVSDPELEACIQTQNYAELARRYRLIESAAVNVVVPYNAEARALMDEARNQGIGADWVRRARPYAVPFFLPKSGPPAFLETVFLRYGAEAPDWFLCPDDARYDAQLGFTPEEGLGMGLVI
ncbi:CRISPR-associated endonuclease Cas3'' [Meiothermus rufus]|uniref:CRISPR-associated endonuclease Cas3'' n=1 Tax=Meiothermus rufus TaxID=604332 RepID=UPI0004861CD7|nr:CRISPR-associated endonuclease Cas3'' [Meiothermus rufus]